MWDDFAQLYSWCPAAPLVIDRMEVFGMARLVI
jgi:hypothetical protein